MAAETPQAELRSGMETKEPLASNSLTNSMAGPRSTPNQNLHASAWKARLTAGVVVVTVIEILPR
jgi:hypothetical protein